MFASWCGPFNLEMPHIVRAANHHDPGQVMFLDFNLRENPEAIQSFQGDDPRNTAERAGGGGERALTGPVQDKLRFTYQLIMKEKSFK